jgi:hypothetical protein
VVSIPLRALLQQRLANCRMSGTSITDNGITVSTNTQPGECIIFFRTDSDAGRNCLDIAGAKACDCLVFYTLAPQAGEKLCLLELKKPAKLGEAKEQILTVHYAVKKILHNMHTQNPTWMAFICLSHNVPSGDLRHINELKRIIKGKVQFKIVRKQYTNFGSFLRQ